MTQETIVRSVSVAIKPLDNRYRYWAKVVRAGTPLPLPEAVDGAGSIPGPYLALGEEELEAGDYLITGEANHHRRSHGWGYRVYWMDASGKLRALLPTAEDKAVMKAQGLDVRYLRGSGELAAAVRVMHALRAGICL